MGKQDLLDFTDTLVKHHVALKAKEKGFFCITPHRFLNENKILGGWIHGNIPEPSIEDIEKYLNNFDDLLIAPTPGIIHEWLKRFHNISVHTEPRLLSSGKLIFSFYLFKNKKLRIKVRNASEIESDAFEAGLYEALCRLP